MEKVKVEVNLYRYDELNDDGKAFALNEHRDFLDSLPEEYENDDGEMLSEYIEHDDEQTEESILINEYFFFADGKMANCVTYTDGHEKTGITEFNFLGEVYQI